MEIYFKMTFKQIHEKITESQIFKRFKQEHSDAELVAGFFILDFLSNNTKETLDYKTDSKIFTFSLENNEITFKEDKLIDAPDKPQLTKISGNIKIDLDEIPSIAEKLAIENNVKNKFQKIIAVLQIHENKEIWNLTCMLDGITILNILIDANTEEIIKFEKKSMIDFIKRR